MSLTLPLIALGGAAGSVLRYLMVFAIGAPLGTAAVNVLGSFAIGVLFVLIGSRESWHLFLDDWPVGRGSRPFRPSRWTR